MAMLKRKFGGHSIEADLRIERARRGLIEISQDEIDRLDRYAAERFRARRRLGLTSLDLVLPVNRSRVSDEVARARAEKEVRR